jgi:alpha-1,3-rhamnosyl/mannosyltransferase
MIFIGTVEPRKNLLRLLEAFRTARQERRIAHRLLVVGKRGWKDDDIVAALNSYAREGWCTWVGYAPPGDMAAMLASADALLYPSLDEGFGLPPLEAMSAGVPVLATTAGAVPEVVGEAALLVDPLDTDQIAAGISALAQDGAARARLAAMGLERAHKFTWAATASRTLSAYERAAQA